MIRIFFININLILPKRRQNDSYRTLSYKSDVTLAVIRPKKNCASSFQFRSSAIFRQSGLKNIIGFTSHEKKTS